MSKFFKKKSAKNADDVKFCFQVNQDQMLFFSTEEEMKRYLSDYRKRIPIYQLTMFRVEFFKMV